MTASILPAVVLLLTPGITPPAPLTMEAAVRTALDHSPHLRAARFEARAAQVEVDRDRPVARPTITAQAQGTLQGPRVTFPRAGDGDATVLPERYGRVELDVEQPLYRPGLGAARARYAARTRATAFDYARARNDLILETRSAFLNVLTAEAMAGVARDGEALARRHLELTRDMLQAGTASERDVKVAEADLAEAEQGSLKARHGIELARADLNRVMGQDAGAAVSVLPPGPAPQIPAGPEAGVAAALSRRPEIRQIEENLRAAQAGISLAATQDKPALSARATAARQTASAFTRETYCAATLQVTWSILDAGKTRADVREARERAGQLAALLDEAKLGIRLAVEKAWRDMGQAQAQLTTAERQVAAARQAYEISEVRFEKRMATQMEASGALLGLARAEANRAQALYALHAAAADYAHATGQDVPDALELP